MLEVNLLKNLDHQHIVAYKQSYFTLEMLIIIMEYCEVGDLSYHIKRKIKNDEYFTEFEIYGASFWSDELFRNQSISKCIQKF